jgi:hypothetical protein
MVAAESSPMAWATSTHATTPPHLHRRLAAGMRASYARGEKKARPINVVKMPLKGSERSADLPLRAGAWAALCTHALPTQCPHPASAMHARRSCSPLHRWQETTPRPAGVACVCNTSRSEQIDGTQANQKMCKLTAGLTSHTVISSSSSTAHAATATAAAGARGDAASETAGAFPREERRRGKGGARADTTPSSSSSKHTTVCSAAPKIKLRRKNLLRRGSLYQRNQAELIDNEHQTDNTETTSTNPSSREINA